MPTKGKLYRLVSFRFAVHFGSDWSYVERCSQLNSDTSTVTFEGGLSSGAAGSRLFNDLAAQTKLDVTIAQLDRRGAPVILFRLINARYVKHGVRGWENQSTDSTVEFLTIAHDGFKRVDVEDAEPLRDAPSGGEISGLVPLD